VVGSKNEWIDGMSEWMGGWVDGRMGGWIYRRMDKWMDGWMSCWI